MKRYLRQYEDLAKDMTQYYKRSAINNFLIGMYCKDDEKYKSKHNELI